MAFPIKLSTLKAKVGAFFAALLVAWGVYYIIPEDTPNNPPPVTTTTTTSTSVKPPTTTTAGSSTTVKPTTTLPPVAGFPTETSTGVPAGTVLKPWPWANDTRNVTLPIETVQGQSCYVIDGYLIDFGTTGNHLDTFGCVLVRNSKITSASEVSNTGAMIQGRGPAIIVQNSSFDGGPKQNRGVQSDDGNIRVTGSYFIACGNAAIEKNDRQGDSDYFLDGNYVTVKPGWPRDQHVDGVQIGGARDVTITHNTILIPLWGGAVNDTGYVSNSALGLWAELGNVNGTVLVDNNLLAGGGRTIYNEQKAPFAWKGPVKITNNVFDVRYGPKAAVWGPLYQSGLPANLTWTGNTFSDGRVLTLDDAKSKTKYP